MKDVHEYPMISQNYGFEKATRSQKENQQHVLVKKICSLFDVYPPFSRHFIKLHHRRPQTVGGFKGRFEEKGRTHEITATGIVKMSAISVGNHFTFNLFQFRLFCRNAKCQKTMKETSDTEHVCGSKQLNQAV